MNSQLSEDFIYVYVTSRLDKRSPSFPRYYILDRFRKLKGEQEDDLPYQEEMGLLDELVASLKNNPKYKHD